MLVLIIKWWQCCEPSQNPSMQNFWAWCQCHIAPNLGSLLEIWKNPKHKPSTHQNILCALPDMSGGHRYRWSDTWLTREGEFLEGSLSQLGEHLKACVYPAPWETQPSEHLPRHSVALQSSKCPPRFKLCLRTATNRNCVTSSLAF